MSLGLLILPYLSVTAIVSTIGMFLTGLSICQRIKQRGTSEGTGSAPFLIAFVSCAFWTQYGILKEDTVVIIINVIGFLLQSSYLYYYYSMTRSKRWLNRVIGVELLAIIGMEYMVQYGELPDQGRDFVGSICVVLNIANIGAPLLGVGEVIRSKSSESLPLPLCVASLCVSLQWLAYGIIVEDIVIQTPNYVATFLCLVQLSLFIIYPRRTVKYSKLSDDDSDNI